MRRVRPIIISLVIGSALGLFAPIDRAQGAGVTIVTHGFEALPGMPDWLNELGNDIAARAGAAGEVTVFDMIVRGDFLQPAQVVLELKRVVGPGLQAGHSGEIVIRVNWSGTSGILPHSSGQVAGAIVTSLRTFSGGQLLTLPIHLIGHSRGGSLVSEVARLLGREGIWVDHVTTLDPHPADGSWIGGVACPNLNYGDAEVKLWDNTIYADNYYRTDDGSLSECDGMPVATAANRDLTQLLGEAAPNAHSLVHAFYDFTVDLEGSDDGDGILLESGWYPLNYARDRTGFHFSRLANGSRGPQGQISIEDGSAHRPVLDRTFANWPNVQFYSDRRRQWVVGQTYVLGMIYSDNDSAPTIRFFPDDDQNPYNNAPSAELASITPAQKGAATYITLPTLLTKRWDDRYVYAEVVDDQGRRRFHYLPGGSFTLTFLDPMWWFTIDRNLSGKVTSLGKGADRYIGCYARGASKGLTVDGPCLGKAGAKITSAFAKIDLKAPGITTGDGPARDADTAAFASASNAAIGSAAGKCDAAKQKLVGKYIAGIAGCYAKAAAKTGAVDNGAGGCTAKAADKLLAGVIKAELGVGCTNLGQAAALAAAADSYLRAQVCLLDPTNTGCAICGNGVIDAGEDCDPVGGRATSCAAGSNTSDLFTCSPTCQCACPTALTFAGDPNDPASLIDAGWTGIAHRAPIISNADTTVSLSCSAASRPCGTCTVSGPVANGPGKLDSQRCTNDTSIRCTSDAPCAGGGGTCQFFFGSDLPLAAGGVTTCMVSQFNGAVSGTANVETGEVATVANLTTRVYTGISIDSPCVRCIGDPTINDGVQGGTCDGGAHPGGPCDGNGTLPDRPDFGTTSLDCPLAAAALIATLPIHLSNATDPVTMTVSANSPTCNGAPGERCLCDTCNNANQEPCSANADCPAPAGPTGPICGGKRCLGGTNNGAPCVAASECPGGGICGRPGEPTAPSSCLDDTSTPGVLDCVDADADGEGECMQGPVDYTCSVGSGHHQRGCLADADCGGGVGGCEASNRLCFTTGGFSGRNGTNTLTAVGREDAPMGDVSNPTLGSVFCVAPTASSSVNNVAGLPGPGRATIKGQAFGKP